MHVDTDHIHYGPVQNKPQLETDHVNNR